MGSAADLVGLGLSWLVTGAVIVWLVGQQRPAAGTSPGIEPSGDSNQV